MNEAFSNRGDGFQPLEESLYHLKSVSIVARSFLVPEPLRSLL